jgi:hypothetical protein
MKYVMTMNMPAQSGRSVHQIIAGHNAKSIEEFTRAVNETDFIVVEEFYYKGDRENGEYFSNGMISVNCQWIGKIKATRD